MKADQLFSKGINSPTPPFVIPRKYVAKNRKTSAKAIVDKAKKWDFNLKHGRAIAMLTNIAKAAPANIPIHGEIPKLRYNNVEVYAPIPKKAVCPNEVCPANPPIKFQADATTE